MAAFTCVRYDRPDFCYSVHAKTKAAYEPTAKAEKELERRKDSATISHADINRPQYKEAIAVYESELVSLDMDPSRRIEQEQTDQYQELSAFYNKHGQHQKRQAQAKRARKAEFDILTNHILTAMGTHTAKAQDPNRRGLILIGLGDFSPT
ncbi:hypothetical protein BGZ72_003615, partial [Mortierella alpina]